MCISRAFNIVSINIHAVANKKKKKKGRTYLKKCKRQLISHTALFKAGFTLCVCVWLYTHIYSHVCLCVDCQC